VHFGILEASMYLVFFRLFYHLLYCLQNDLNCVGRCSLTHFATSYIKWSRMRNHRICSFRWKAMIDHSFTIPFCLLLYIQSLMTVAVPKSEFLSMFPSFQWTEGSRRLADLVGRRRMLCWQGRLCPVAAFSNFFFSFFCSFDNRGHYLQ